MNDRVAVAGVVCVHCGTEMELLIPASLVEGTSEQVIRECIENSRCPVCSCLRSDK